MPKIKTKKGVAKRFKLTKTGEIKRKKAYSSHLLSSKSPKRKRGLRQPTVLNKVDVRNIKRLIPYA